MTHSRSILTFIALALTSSLLASCASTHIREYVPKRRTYKSPVSFDQDDSKGTNGSLFRANHAATYLFADHRAMRIGDIVTVRAVMVRLETLCGPSAGYSSCEFS